MPIADRDTGWVRSSTLRTFVLTAILGSVLLAGCAGPSKLTRQLDQVYNQTYVDNPLLTEAMLPFFGLGFVGTWVIDHALVNPVYWWEDVFESQGTPFYYRNPTVPETPAEGDPE